MSTQPVPWLADLPDEWEAHETAVAAVEPSMVYEAQPRKGLSLLDHNTQNARDGASSIRAGTMQKHNTNSTESLVQYNTVERQVSPVRKEADMTWKKRLVDGDLGYGDQTDLFGPSALENIFQSPSKPSSAAKSRINKVQLAESFPSSPPPWPTSLPFKDRTKVIFPSMSIPDEAETHPASELPEQEPSFEQSEVAEEEHSAMSNNSEPSQLSMHGARSFTERTVSGQTEIGNLTFSPVFISKHTTLDGEINYTPLDSETARMLQSSSTATAQTIQQAPAVPQPREADQDSVDFGESRCQIEVTLPDDLPTGTPPVSALGNFITMQRGGLSDCGSFKTRPLSPSPAETRNSSSNTVLPADQSGEASEATANAVGRTAIGNSCPATPTRAQPVAQALQVPKSASPLKLFGNHDTFTNKKLLRRLSQLEDSAQAPAQEAARDHHQVSTPLPAPEDDVFSDGPSFNSAAQATLDNYEEHDSEGADFEADLSFGDEDADAYEEEPEPVDRSPSGSPEPGVQPPGAISPFMFHVEECDTQPEIFGVKRKLSDRSTNKSRQPPQSPRQHQDGTAAITKPMSRDSPRKFPTPKRQRTLHHLDLEMERLSLMDNTTDEISLPEQADDSLPEVQDRPTNPTPDQAQLIKSDLSSLNFMSSSPRLRAIQDMIEESSLPGSIKLVSQAKAVASEVAAFTLNVTKHDSDIGERKRSITTQDFLNEAMHIMSLIRARGRPSGLGSVEESNEESSMVEEPSELPSIMSPSILRVSRPPSREGANSGWRPRSQPTQDPQVADQLNRFREKDDMEILDATLHSLKLRGMAEDRLYSEQSDGSAGNIRISGPIAAIPEEESFYSDPFQVHNERPNTMDSQGSAAYSTGRTQGSGSTRASDNLAHLAPESVAHLIPQTVGGMVFDEAQGKWVRTRNHSQSLDREHQYHQPSNVGSDDDPFGNIPDLTVDELEEMERVQTSQTSKGLPSDEHDYALENGSGGTYNRREEYSTVRPSTGYSRATYLDSSTAPTYKESTQQQIETRATSWATDQQCGTHGKPLSKSCPATTQPMKQVFHSSPPLPSADLQGFSSDLPRRPSSPESDIVELPRQPHSSAGRKVSFKPASFARRFRSDPDASELSLIAELPDKRLVSVSVAVSRPPGNDESQIAKLDNSSVILSDLPDFTVADVDYLPGPSERNLAATVARHGQEIAGDRYALAVQELVKTLTDVKGDEPFWDEIRQLDLRKQGLGSLYGLDTFCAALQGLDIAGNDLAHLEGLPWGVRWLNVSGNCLTSLTAWERMVNLQYLDISGNQISDVDGLGCLVHLRELKAVGNGIKSLRGLEELDGLIKLDLSGNEIAEVQLERTKWTRLESLNLSDNKLTAIGHIDSLPSLKELVLDNNKLMTLDIGTAAPAMQQLSACHNELTSLDVSRTPALRLLALDHNLITSLSGVNKLQHLDTLSLRHQPSPAIWDILSHPLHVRHLHLSGTPLPAPLPISTTQNTISTLSLGTCGIADLPSNFGLHFPNLSTLHLSNNAIKDIRPLLNITPLKHLHLSGNRLSKLRKCVETLARLPSLESVDLRDNTITQGFYPGAVAGSVIRRPDDTINIEGVEDGVLPDRGEDGVVDEDTQLRRRVHEILIVAGCKALVKLDGKVVDRAAVLKRDAAWERLKELGVLKVKA